MYKKILTLIVALTLVAFTNVSFAKNHQGHGTSGPHGSGQIDHNPGNQGNGNGHGNAGSGENYDADGIAFGTGHVEGLSIGGGLDCDYQRIPNGIAGGIGVAGGLSHGEGSGMIVNGDLNLSTNTIGGGLVCTQAYIFHPNGVDLGIGVGSRTDTYAVTGADLLLGVDPERHGFGLAGGEICGLVGQGSLNGSMLGSSPLRSWSSDGITYGVAGQGSIGGFHGDAGVMSGPDLGHGRCGINSLAGASIGANIEMTGTTLSESYRYINNDGAVHTEGMGTNVLASTQVTATGHACDWDRGLSCAGADVSGGYVAGGGVMTKTNQQTRGGVASAQACGLYVGAGELNTQFNGSAAGGTYTSATTVNGMNGSIMSSGASMTVTSTISPVHNN